MSSYLKKGPHWLGAKNIARAMFQGQQRFGGGCIPPLGWAHGVGWRLGQQQRHGHVEVCRCISEGVAKAQGRSRARVRPDAGWSHMTRRSVGPGGVPALAAPQRPFPAQAVHSSRVACGCLAGTAQPAGHVAGPLWRRRPGAGLGPSAALVDAYLSVLPSLPPSDLSVSPCPGPCPGPRPSPRPGLCPSLWPCHWPCLCLHPTRWPGSCIHPAGHP